MFFPILALLFTAISAGVGFMGAQRSAAAAVDAGEAQKKAADQAAANEDAQAQEAINRQRINNRRALARLHSDVAGTSGTTMDGSNMDVFAETSGNMELHIQDEARAAAIQSQNMRNQGEMSLWQARSQAAGQTMASYGSLIASGANLAGQGYRYFGRSPMAPSQSLIN